MNRRRLIGAIALPILLSGCLTDRSGSDETGSGNKDNNNNTSKENNESDNDQEYLQQIHLINRTEQKYEVTVKISAQEVVFKQIFSLEPNTSKSRSITLYNNRNYTIKAKRGDGEEAKQQIRTGSDDHGIEVLLDNDRMKIIQITAD